MQHPNLRNPQAHRDVPHDSREHGGRVAGPREGFNRPSILRNRRRDRSGAGQRNLLCLLPLFERFVLGIQFFLLIVIPEAEATGNPAEEEECPE